MVTDWPHWWPNDIQYYLMSKVAIQSRMSFQMTYSITYSKKDHLEPDVILYEI